MTLYKNVRSARSAYYYIGNFNAHY